MEITIAGSTSNNGTYTAITVIAGTINVATASLTAEGAGDTVTITSSLADVTTTGSADAGSTAAIVKDAGLNPTLNYWRRGSIEFTSGDLNGEVRTIKSNDAVDAFTMSLPFSANPGVGDTFTIKRGCDKTTKNCDVTYANYLNFGGFAATSQTRQPG